MRRLRWLAVVLGLALSACSGSTASQVSPAGPSAKCDQIYALLRFTPSQIQQDQAAGGCVHPNVSLTGELKGQVRAAHIDQPCPRLERGANLPANTYDFELGGALYTLRLDPSPTVFDRKPVTVPAGSQARPLAEVRQQPTGATTAPRTWLATTGKLAADSTGTAGTLDLTLARDVAGASPVQIIGTWSCSGPGRRVLASSPQLSGPCASAFATATPPQDASSLRSGRCQPQDLTLMGAIDGHIADAVALKVDQGLLAGTDACGGDPHHFAVNLVTGVAGEQVSVEMKLATDPFTGQPLSAGDYGPISQDVVPSPTVIIRAGQAHWDSQAGTLSLDGSRTSGSLSMDFKGGVSGDQLVHLSGQWKCA